MQAGRGRRHRTLMLGIHGLIAAVVFIIGRALDIGRQRQMAVVRQQFIHTLAAGKTQAKQLALPLQHRGLDAALKHQLRARLGRF